MPLTKGLIKRDSTYISLNMTPEALIKAMRVHGLTATKVIKPIADALEAKKLIIHNGDNPDGGWTEEIIDHQTRLKAATMAIELLGLKRPQKALEGLKIDDKDMKKMFKDSDTVELQRAVFSKADKE
jgi:hypothetical protein